MGATFEVAEAVFALAPGYRRHVVLARGAAHLTPPAHLATRFDAAVAALVGRADLDTLAEHPAVRPWRLAFKAAGWNPGKFRSSIEALLRRALRGELEPLGLSAVDAGTVVTLEHLVPVGVHILDDLGPDPALVLGPAAGDETFQLFGGQVESPDPGEIVYRVGPVVLTRRWVWRQGAVGSVTPQARSYAVNVDVVDASVLDGSAAVAAMTEVLGWCGLQVTGALTLDATTPAGRVDEGLG
ncbi:MAG: phenylalanine--tRNA ligase beta subunit-related protein [Dermatophilaceae bacterium]